MNALFNDVQSRSRKGRDTPEEEIEQYPQQSPPLPESPPAPPTAATPSGIKSDKLPPKLPSGRLPPFQPPPVLEPCESSATADSFFTITTTTAPIVDANEIVSPASSSSLPKLSTGIADTAQVQRTLRSNTPYSQSNGSYTIDNPRMGPGYREPTLQKFLSELVLSEEM